MPPARQLTWAAIGSFSRSGAAQRCMQMGLRHIHHPSPFASLCATWRSSPRHHQHDIAVLRGVENGLGQFRHVLDKIGSTLPATAPHAPMRVRRRHDGRFAGGVDFGEEQGVHADNTLAKSSNKSRVRV